MITFPNAKINLGLRILRKRSDGYHDIETVFYPVALNDALEIITQPEQKSKISCQFTNSGLKLEITGNANICVSAYKRLKKDFPHLPHIKMHLHKCIPVGAGLGGGSSDSAFTLKMLNNMFNLDISTEKLMQYAAELGSDCPFFILNRPCYATGRGDVLQPIDVNLSDYSILLVNPGIHIDTGNAFSDIIPSIPDKSVIEIITHLPVEKWKKELFNDFEKVIFLHYPEIAQLKNELYQKGAVYASMTGSGSTVYGIFKKGAVPRLNLPSHYVVKKVSG